MAVKVAAIMKTNIPRKSVHEEFLCKFSEHLAKEFNTKVEHVTLEVQTDCLMMRSGSTAIMALIQLYHNDDRCNEDTKHEYAGSIAQYLAHDNIKLPEDRVLVLFHDTRKCA